MMSELSEESSRCPRASVSTAGWGGGAAEVGVVPLGNGVEAVPAPGHPSDHLKSAILAHLHSSQKGTRTLNLNAELTCVRWGCCKSHRMYIATRVERAEN